MGQHRKTWAEKLNIDKAAKAVTLERDYAGARAGTRMLVATPRLVDQYIRAIPRGQTRSIAEMRLARMFHEGTRMIAQGFAPESRREKEEWLFHCDDEQRRVRRKEPARAA